MSVVSKDAGAVTLAALGSRPSSPVTTSSPNDNVNGGLRMPDLFTIGTGDFWLGDYVSLPSTGL